MKLIVGQPILAAAGFQPALSEAEDSQMGQTCPPHNLCNGAIRLIRQRRPSRSLLALLSVCIVAAAPKTETVRVEPTTIALTGPGAGQRILVLERAAADMLELDATSDATLSVTDMHIARIEEGRVIAVADGKTTLQVTLNGRHVAIPVEVHGTRAAEPVTFRSSVLPILTRRGCNGSDCHGGVKGRAGFKLSLNGLDPREDYKWIVKGGGYQVLTAVVKDPVKPRVDTAAPEKSLVLLKPTMTIPHGGGLRFKAGSADYLTILNWVKQGAPFGDDSPAGEAIERVEVSPSLIVLGASGKSHVIVTGYLANGQTRDLSNQVRYQSLNSGIFTVAEDGLVQAVAPGEASLLVHAVGHFANAQVAVAPAPVPSAARIGVPERNFIDREVFAKLRKIMIPTSGISSDEEFLRRVCIDLTGTLPPPNRVREFLASKDPHKRDKLIDTLIASPEFTDYWTLRFADLFRVGPGIPQGNPEYFEWVRSSIAANKPYNQFAAERIASEGYNAPSRRYIEQAKVAAPERNMGELMRVFMGRRLDCAQCHNHPSEAWTQKQFWGLSAFFGKLTMTDWVANQVVYDDPDGQEVDQTAGDHNTLHFIKVVNPRTKEPVTPAFPDGRVLDARQQSDPRKALADWMTSYPWFAEAAANRIWGYFFARSIVSPVDDFRATNPPTNTLLLKALADDFRTHGYDIRHFIRNIVQSTAYQLSSLPAESNDYDVVNYSHTVPRPLEAEVLLDGISAVTGVPETFGNQPSGTRAIELQQPSGNSGFLQLYGAPRRSAVDERDNQGNLRQALHLLVGDTYTKKLSKPGSRLDKLLQAKRSNGEIIEEFYLAAFARYPTDVERQALQRGLDAHGDSRDIYEDLLWALLSSREFADNH